MLELVLLMRHVVIVCTVQFRQQLEALRSKVYSSAKPKQIKSVLALEIAPIVSFSQWHLLEWSFTRRVSCLLLAVSRFQHGFAADWLSSMWKRSTLAKSQPFTQPGNR